MNRTLATACIGVVVLGLGSTATAETKTFVPTDSNWNNGANWSPTGVPTEADRVIIPNGKACTVDISTAVADTLEVQADGYLTISAGAKLTLDRDELDVSIVTTIDGTVRLERDGSLAGVLHFAENDQDIYGSGAITGTNVLCEIRIDAGTMLTNYMATPGWGIRDELTIRGLTGTTNGKFRNYGLVEAGKYQYMVLHADTIVSDNSSAKWSTVNCSTLRFEADALNLRGNFTVNCGATLHCRKIVETCGQLTYRGEIILDAGAEFYYVAFSATGECPGFYYYPGQGPPCPNPGELLDPFALPSCSNPYVVDQSTECTFFCT